VLAIAICAGLAGSANASERTPATLRVVGEATATAAPDVAWLDLAVVSDAATAEEAVRNTAKGLDAVLAALRKSLGESGTLATQGYHVTPRYQYDKTTSRPRLDGYSARGGLVVTLRDLERVGRAIDSATGAGANEIGGLRFGWRDEAPRRAEALAAAARDARARAQVLASALDLSVARVLSVEELGSDLPQPMLRAQAFMAESKSAATPIEAQDVVVRARVALVVEVVAAEARAGSGP